MRPEKDCVAEPIAPDVADEFNREFASVGARIATELKENSRNVVGVSPKPPRVIAAKLTLHPVTLPELSKCLSDLSSSRAVGVDGVPLFAIKNCFAVLAPHITTSYHQCVDCLPCLSGRMENCISSPYS